MQFRGGRDNKDEGGGVGAKETGRATKTADKYPR